MKAKHQVIYATNTQGRLLSC